MERIRANIIYALIASVFIYLIWAYFFDQAKATGNCLDGKITKIETISTGTGIRSGGSKNTDFYAYISLENNKKIVKKISSRRDHQIGEEVKLREFRSEIRGVLKYEISNCN